jgi:hypothetical protein
MLPANLVATTINNTNKLKFERIDKFFITTDI